LGAFILENSTKPEIKKNLIIKFFLFRYMNRVHFGSTPFKSVELNFDVSANRERLKVCREKVQQVSIKESYLLTKS